MSIIIKKVASGFLLAMFSLSAFAHDGLFGDEHAQWSFTGEHNDIVYLVDHAEARIDRYDLAQSSWLTPLIPPALPTAFAVDSTGIIIATERSTYTVGHGSTDFVFIGNSVSSVQSIATDGSTLYLSLRGSPSFATRDRITGALIERRDFFYEMAGTVFFPVHNLLVGRSTGVSPSDIVSINLDEPEDFRAQVDSEYHGDYPNASRLWEIQGQSRVIDNSGTVYSIPDLTWIGSAAAAVDDLAFIDGVMFVLSNGRLSRRDEQYRELGYRAVGENSEALFAHNGVLIVFSMEQGTPTVTTVNSDTFTSAMADSIEPAAVSFQADSIIEALDGSLLILSEANKALFRYSPDSRSYTQGYVLRGSPVVIAHALDADAVFLGYDSGVITRLDLGTGIESVFANLPSGVRALIPFNNNLFVNDTSGAWGSFRTLDMNGAILDSIDWREPDSNQVWNGAMGEMLRLAFGQLTAQSILSDASFGGERAASDFTYTTRPPLIMSPDASLVLDGSGSIHSTATLELQDSLADSFISATWTRNGYIVSLAPVTGNSIIFDNETNSAFDVQVWGERYEPIKRITFDALGAQLVSVGDRVMLVVDEGQAQPRVIEIVEGSNDIDEDGVNDNVDAYPIDPLRSLPGDMNEAPDESMPPEDNNSGNDPDQSDESNIPSDEIDESVTSDDETGASSEVDSNVDSTNDDEVSVSPEQSVSTGGGSAGILFLTMCAIPLLGRVRRLLIL